MGRYDALTDLEEKPEKKPSKKLDTEAVARELAQAQSSGLPGSAFFPTRKQSPAPIEKPANPQAGKPASQPSTLASSERPEKYTTRLEPSLVRKVRLHAVEEDLNDYDVVRNALLEYFARRK